MKAMAAQHRNRHDLYRRGVKAAAAPYRNPARVAHCRASLYGVMQ